MLNILLCVVLLNVTVIAFYFTFKINRVEQVFNSFETGLVYQCVNYDIEKERYFFVKDQIVEVTKYYFEENLENIEYKLKIAFREDDLNTTFSETPNIVQIDIYATILFDGIYTQNVRFMLDGRKVSKDWWSTF
jgi:hypothetical protein